MIQSNPVIEISHKEISGNQTVLAIFIALFLMSCGPSAVRPSEVKPARSQIRPHDSKQTKIPCPSHEFSRFIEIFLDEQKLQESFTRFPLESTQYDPQHLEDEPHTYLLQKHEVDFPLILNRQMLKEKGVEIEMSAKSADLYEVSTHSRGSGAYTRVYLFKKHAGCWFLISTTDGST